MGTYLCVAGAPADAVRTPVSVLLTSRRTVDLCRVGSCLCRAA